MRDRIATFTKTSSFQFFKHNTGNVEVVKNGEILEIFFPVQPVCRKMKAKTMEHFR